MSSTKDFLERVSAGADAYPPMKIESTSEGGPTTDLLEKTGRTQDGEEGYKISWAWGAYNLIRSGAAAGLQLCRNAIGKGYRGHRDYGNDHITHT